MTADGEQLFTALGVLAQVVDAAGGVLHLLDQFLKFGNCLGHRKGIRGEELLEYIDARKEIYLPAYKWVLENKLKKLVTAIRVIAKNKPVVLLDYDTNTDVNNPKKPLSHASLIKAYIEGNYPE